MPLQLGCLVIAIAEYYIITFALGFHYRFFFSLSQLTTDAFQEKQPKEWHGISTGFANIWHNYTMSVAPLLYAVQNMNILGPMGRLLEVIEILEEKCQKLPYQSNLIGFKNLHLLT